MDGIYTNTAPVDAYRGAGRPEATFVIERMVEVAARELGQDPASFRRKNFVRKFPHQTPIIMMYDAGDYTASLDKALEMADYKNFGKRKRESARNGKLRGIGFSAYIEACGIAPSAAVGSLGAGVGLWESAEVRVNPVGTVEVLTGSHSHGQGHETTFAQLVSDRLGIDINSVAIVHGDTDKVQFGMGTYGSRSGAVGMSAISKALDKVIAKGKKVAAYALEASEDDIEFKDGRFSVAGTDKSLAFGEVALQAYIAHKFSGQELEPGLKEGAFYDPTNFTFPAGVHICEVEIDPDTGVTKIERWTAVDDFGNIINPMIVEGQVHGGIAQGVGQAMLEGAHYDASGQLVTASYMDYCMPRADDLPSFQVGTTVTPCPSNPLGIKGCGEAGAIAAPPAVINAITDALGHEDIAMPATPEAVWKAARSPRRRLRRSDPSILIHIPEMEPMYAFNYASPKTVRQAASALAKAADDGKLLAGGQTLLPTMKQRLASPAHADRPRQGRGPFGHRAQGPLARHRRDDEARRCGEVRDRAAGHSRPCGPGRRDRRSRRAQSRHHRRLDRQQRPCGRLPGGGLALNATIVTNKRKIPADQFFTGLFDTALEPGEIVVKVSFPIPSRAAYAKFRNPASRYALVGVFVAKRGSDVRVAVTGAGANGVFRATSARGGPEEALLPEVARRHDAAGDGPQRRYPRQPGISRPSDRRHGQAGGDDGHRQVRRAA